MTFAILLFSKEQPNGLRYLRWGRDGEAVQLEKGYSVGNCLGCAQNPQRQVHALLGGVCVICPFMILTHPTTESHLDSPMLTGSTSHHYVREFGREKENHLVLQVILQLVVLIGN